MKRGFVDYNDFKDQKDAIDMLFLEEDEINVASELYRRFQDRGLVDK